MIEQYLPQTNKNTVAKSENISHLNKAIVEVPRHAHLSSISLKKGS
jgi:hypothetical protein